MADILFWLINIVLFFLVLDEVPSFVLLPLTRTPATTTSICDQFRYQQQQQQQQQRFNAIFLKLQLYISPEDNNNNSRNSENMENKNKNNIFSEMFDDNDPTKSLLDDEYCSVVTDDMGCEAYEEKKYSTDDATTTTIATATTKSSSKISRLVRIEKQTDESVVKEIGSCEDVFQKIKEVKEQQSVYGRCDLYPRQWSNTNKQTTEEEQEGKFPSLINGETKKKETILDNEKSKQILPIDNDDDDQFFTVMQFNILAEGLSSGPTVKTPFNAEESSSNDYGGFSTIPNPNIVLDNSLRRWRLLEVILGGEVAADIIAIQEIDRFRGFFAPLLRLFGYGGIFIPKPHAPGIKLGWYSDGCALFWKQEKFVLLAEQRFGFKLGNQVIILAMLQHVATEKQMLVAVTHLKAQKSEQNEKIRCRQVDELLSHIQTFVNKHNKQEDGNNKKMGVLILGDFNADPPCDIMKGESSVSRVLNYHHNATNGGETESADSNTGDQQTRIPRFLSAYDIDAPLPEDAEGKEHPTQPSASTSYYTTWKTRGTKTVRRIIDYIFHSDDLQCLETLDVPNPKVLEECKLPCLRYPSDHVMIAAKFKII